MKNKPTILILVILLFSLVSTLVSADLGPKPSVDIYVTLDGKSVPDATFNAKLLTCQNEENQFPVRDIIPQLNVTEYDPENNCYWKPAEFAWGGECQNGTCYFTYHIPSKFRLAVYLPSQDKVYLSAEVIRENFRSTFEANLLSNGSIELQEITPFSQTKFGKNIRNFFIALILTLILELFVALIYVLSTKISKKVLISVLIANIISFPIIWFVFPLLKIIPSVMLLGEFFAFVFEGYFIYLFNKDILPLKKSFVLSILMNLVSWIIGGFIFLFLLDIFYPFTSIPNFFNNHYGIISFLSYFIFF